MRIIGNIEHPGLKITVFKMDNKLSVKFETGLYEQTYKFRESEYLKEFADMQRLVDEEFIQCVEARFASMHQEKNEAMLRFLPPARMDLPEEII
ncbi:MAG: hypothetical protein RI973_1141 [Bacteroidota bacterium]|jgi:hypothetical protein